MAIPEVLIQAKQYFHLSQREPLKPPTNQSRDELFHLIAKAIICGEELDQSEIDQILAADLIQVKALTKQEDMLYREGRSKSAQRILLFLLSRHVQETPIVEAENGKLVERKLDDRPNLPSYPKPGEIIEAWEAISEFENQDGSEESEISALNLLLEVSDVFYNLFQLESQDISISEISNVLVDVEQAENKEIRSLLIVLSTLAMWKFQHRYLENYNKAGKAGVKDNEAEIEFILERLDHYGNKIFPEDVEQFKLVRYLESKVGMIKQILEMITVYAREKLVVVYNNLFGESELSENINLVLPYLISVAD